jgi:hypothetical protein
VAVTLLLAMGATIGRAQPLPNIVEQFQKIRHSGSTLAFHLGEGDDPYPWTSMWTHYTCGNPPIFYLYARFLPALPGPRADGCPRGPLLLLDPEW